MHQRGALPASLRSGRRGAAPGGRALRLALRSTTQRFAALAAALVVIVAAIPIAAFGWAAWPWTIAAPSVVTFGLYGYDKRAARRGTWRVPERVLHGLALLGGSPGALLGQRVFRHKTAKRSFQFAFWAIVVLQVALLALIWRAAR